MHAKWIRFGIPDPARRHLVTMLVFLRALRHQERFKSEQKGFYKAKPFQPWNP